MSLEKSPDRVRLAGIRCLRIAATISSKVRSGCFATRVNSHSTCSSNGDVLPPLSFALAVPVSRQRSNRLTGELKRNVLRNRHWFLRYGGAAVPFIFVGLRAQGAERASTVEDIVTGRARISVPIVLGRLSRMPLQASRRLRHLFKSGSISNKDRTFCNSNNTVALPIAKTPVHALARAPHHVSQLPLAVTNDGRLSWHKGAVQVQKSQHRLR
jgi:hypothetical protein